MSSAAFAALRGSASSGQHPMLTLDLFTPNDDARPVFLTGSFNAWVTHDDRFKMLKIKDGHYQYTFNEIPPTGEPFEYKYVKGGWEAEELGQDGHPPVNRRMEVPRGKVADVVPRWKQHTAGYDPQFYPDIQIVAKRFNVPQLRRRRRISVLLPWNYKQTNHHYPVLYLQDGQNLFEDGAPFGTWGVDKRLAALAQHGKGDFIVVAIDHGGKERIKEYSPYHSQRWGEGLGRDYARFLAETLKPHIDKNFRTLPDRQHTGVGGSSMGGLISIYAGLMFPQVYSKFMIFSPSLWASPKIYSEPMYFAAFDSPTKIYLYGGSREGAGMVTNLNNFKDAAERAGHGRAQVRLVTDPKGKHNEARWGEEFPKAAEWLFGG
ncbi:MAG TPA: alpha/beta hydrolase-fold protein [Saprospiraceae bacterium]|nr:alpha/beta hydrolase-fold protein [Saprospiraceae bacterium]